MPDALEDQISIAKDYVTRVAGGGIDESHYAADLTVWTAITGDLSGEAFLPNVRTAKHLWIEPLVMTIDSVTAQPGRVALQTRSKGKLITGADYSNDYMFLIEFDAENKIRHVREYFDIKRLETLFMPAFAKWQAEQTTIGA